MTFKLNSLSEINSAVADLKKLRAIEVPRDSKLAVCAHVSGSSMLPSWFPLAELSFEEAVAIVTPILERQVAELETKLRELGIDQDEQDTDKEPTSRITIEVPADLHRRFKTACSAAGISMCREVQALIELRCTQLESSVGFSLKHFTVSN